MTYSPERMKSYQRKWIAGRKEYYKTKMGPCLFCDTEENIEIHHLDPSRKESHKIFSWREDRIEAELKQCIALCKGCHKKFHDLLKRKPLEHGTLHGYQSYGCRCVECKKARSDYYHRNEKQDGKKISASI